MCLNARSILNKKNQLNIMVDDIKPHIIGITEPWGNDITDAELGLAYYVMFRKDRMGRGVLLFIKETIPAYEVQLHEEAETKGTLIDNILCKLLTPTNINCAGILLNNFSDHQPCFIILNAETKKTHTPNLVKHKIITQNALLNIKNDLMMTNIHGQLDESPNADVNSNYDIMFNEIHRVC